MLPSMVWILAASAALLLIAVALSAARYIPNNRVGIVEKLVSTRGSLERGFIARNGEAGFEPRVLRGGWHVFFPFQYRIHRMPLITIPQGRIGYVFARDGAPLAPTQTLASNATARDFTDVEAFLAQGGQRGPQRLILREGTHAINLAQFVVITEGQVYGLAMSPEEDRTLHHMADLIGKRDGFRPMVITEDLVGIVTVHDGASLGGGEIIAPTVGDDPAHPELSHDDFQDPEKFLRAGGRRGRQLQVLVEGTYYVNRLFATIETIPKTVVEVGTVGVVVSYTGTASEDVSGAEYKHGEMVVEGSRGVWSTPLLPGKYAFNTYAAKVIPVPTTNVILKWIRNESGTHRYDENLAEISLITQDAFEPSLPLSVVMHIDYRKAPLVIQRFGDIRRLVEQTLDPMVAAYFKNVGQTRTLIQLIHDRSAIQQVAGKEMQEKFAHYNLELEEVLIGTPSSPANGDHRIEEILDQLRSRQIATEQIETYTRQQAASAKERELREAEARARQQQHLTESELSIVVETNKGKAEYQRSVQQAEQIRALAGAEADKVKALAEADSFRAARVGIAHAVAMEEQVRAYGGPQFQVVQNVMSRLAEAVERSGADVVPKVVVGGRDGAGGAGAGLLDSVLALLLSDKLGLAGVGAAEPRDPGIEALRTKVREEAMRSRRS